MERNLAARSQMALIGALAGISCFVLGEVIDRQVLSDRATLAVVTWAAVFFTALLVMTGPLAVRRATVAAAGLGLVVALLLTLASLRHDRVQEVFDTGFAALAALVLGTVPLPFLIAANGAGWRDYPTLFGQSWTIVVRVVSALLFVALVWLVIFLSDALLSLVGLAVVDWLLDVSVVPWVLSGLTLGLALAVVSEMAEVVSPFLLLRLLRLLLPLVLAVMVVFIVALPLRGTSGLFASFSVAATLLSMAGIGATLVTAAVDQGDAEATSGLLMQRLVQALALVLPAPAALGAASVWIRVAEHGWTPDRVFAALMAAVALGYGLSYAVAVLRGSEWMARIRRANVAMALVVLVASALWLSPVLDAERISAQSLVARYTAGRTQVAELDLAALARWGRAGAAARDELAALAAAPDQQALALALAGQSGPAALADDPVQVRADLVAALPLLPPDAGAERDRMLAVLPVEEMRDWLAMCRAPLPQGGAGCVMVVDDFRTDLPGPEAMVLLREPGGYMRLEGIVTENGMVQRRSIGALTGFPPDLAAGEAMIAALQASVAARVTPAPMHQLEVNGQALIVLP